MAKKLTKRQLEKHLSHLEKKQLIAEIGKLFTRFKEVKTYYQMEFSEPTDRKKVLADYKKRVKNQFYNRSGSPRSPKAAELRKIINEFKKVSIVSFDLVDLLLARVEYAVEFTNDFGDIDTPFYNATFNAYRDALKIIHSDQLHPYFQTRCQEIVDSTQYLGWGFHEALSAAYEDCFGDWVNEI